MKMTGFIVFCGLSLIGSGLYLETLKMDKCKSLGGELYSFNRSASKCLKRNAEIPLE
jgi:hypothetical protein